MTQTAEKPIQLDAKGFRGQLIGKFPELAETTDKVLKQLEHGEGKQDLANLLKREIDIREEETAYIYSWTGLNGHAFDLTLLKPFDPTPTRSPQAAEEPAEATEEKNTATESPETVEAPQTDTQAAVEAKEAPDATPKPAATPKKDAPATSSPGLFAALGELIGTSTLLMTLARHDDELTVNVMPFGEDKDSSISAICLTGTPAELDAGFAEAIAVKVQGRESLAEQIEALKEAEKELADAKKAEADAKKAEAAKKTKAAEAKKKEDEKKKQEADAAADKAKSQEALF